MRGEHDAQNLERKLPRVGIAAEVFLIDGEANRLDDGATQLALSGGECIAHSAGPVVVFRDGREDETTPRQGVRGLQPGKPVREQSREARESARLLQRGSEDLCCK